MMIDPNGKFWLDDLNDKMPMSGDKHMKKSYKNRGEIDIFYIVIVLLMVAAVATLIMLIIVSIPKTKNDYDRFEEGKKYAYEKVIGYKIATKYNPYLNHYEERLICPEYTLSEYKGRTFAVIEGKVYWLDSLIFNPKGLLSSPGETPIELNKLVK